MTATVSCERGDQRRGDQRHRRHLGARGPWSGGVTDISTIGEPLFEVRLVQLPVALWAHTQERTDELIREFSFMAAHLHDPTESGAFPTRLVTLIEALTSRYGPVTAQQDTRLAAAAAAGDVEIPLLSFRVPASVADAAVELARTLNESDDYCAQGEHLLTLATAPELVLFREWCLGDFTRQINGRAPRPWSDYVRAEASTAHSQPMRPSDS
jgi:hypothetical protein